ncbi:transposase [Streptomyces varsoviensis]|uniref:transposase n=1 Tax=Streptomyces varsoviensis TaxID=67373 RepID=UPI0037940E96
MARFDVTDAEWALIEPLLPVAATGPLPRRVRDQFNGVLWRFRTGSGWRDVPERYGPWSTVYSRFSGWARAGVFQGLMAALIAEAAARGQVGLHLVSVDSTIVPAHHESDRPAGQPEEEGPGRRAAGHLRSRALQATQHHRALLPEDQDLARPGHPLRQGTRELRGRTPPPRIDHVAETPHLNHMIPTSNSP